MLPKANGPVDSGRQLDDILTGVGGDHRLAQRAVGVAGAVGRVTGLGDGERCTEDVIDVRNVEGKGHENRTTHPLQ